MFNKVLKLFKFFPKIFLWVSNKENRLRLRGARIEVIAHIVTRNPTPSILLGKSAYHDIWMPPQEGVNYSETFEQALFRCMEVECGLKLPTNKVKLYQLFHIRTYRFMDVLDLHVERHGERPIANDLHGTVLDNIQLKRKAYWMAPVIISSQSDIKPKPDGKEIIELKWYSFEDAISVIKDTNHMEKAMLLVSSIKACRKDLMGGQSPSELGK